MIKRKVIKRVVRVLVIGSALAAGLPILIEYTHRLAATQYYYTGQTWTEHYFSFTTGINSLSVNTVLQPTTILIPVTFVHAAWRRSLTVITLFTVFAVILSPIVTLPSSLVPLAAGLCPVCTVSGSGVKVPVGTFAIISGLLCNLSELLGRRHNPGHIRGWQSSADGPTSHLLPATRPELGRILSSLSGYTLVVLFLAIGIGSYHSVGVYPNITGTAVSSLIICAIAFYEFVATNATYSLAALAALTWHATLAALQYDTALSEFLLATATLLTISAAGLLYAGWREFTQTTG